jgi:outer membrane protein assembly factor BamB
VKGLGRLVAAALLAAVLAVPAAAHAEGITNSGGDLRDGWYSTQPRLAPDIVAGGTFGRMWDAPIDGQVYAQPLVDGATVLVLTETNHVYGLDAETGAARWSQTLGPPFDPIAGLSPPCFDLNPTVGATATPVIDPATHIAYFTYKTGLGAAAQWRMGALDTRTGAGVPGFPVTLTGRADNAPGQVFAPQMELQRPGLLLLDGVVYAGFGGHCDNPPYQGWVFGVSTAGAIRARWTTVGSGSGAGIWQSGSGLMSDGPGRIFLSTGNGDAPAPPLDGPQTAAAGHLGEAVVRLAVQSDGKLRAVDAFAPYDAQRLDDWDADFASGGVTALRDDPFATTAVPHPAVAVGKAGYVYLLNRDRLGGVGAGAQLGDDVPFRRGPDGGVWSRPGIWPGDGGWVYVPTATSDPTAYGTSGVLNMYHFGTSASGQPALSLQARSADPFGFGSSAPVVTSDGRTAGSALVWLTWAPAGGGVWQLRAYDAQPQGGRPVLRYSSPIGTGSKFTPPGVGDGRLYVATRDGHVLAYGAPVTQELEAPATTFPTTTVGDTATRTVTVKATRATTVSAITAGPAPFDADVSALGLPRTLQAGDTLAVPVRFAPTAAGTVGGSLSVTTAADRLQFGLSGTGQAAAAKLVTTPAVVSFGAAVVGRQIDGTITLTNAGGTALDITSTDLPSAPFAVAPEDVPDRLQPGQSVSVAVHFRPTAPGSFSDELALRTSAGEAVVGLTATAGVGPQIALTTAGADAGAVRVGEGATATLTVGNTGDAALRIMKSKSPAGAGFSALDELPEGTTLAPGEQRSLRVRFAPTAPGAAEAVWTITGDDGSGVHEVRFTGSGVVAAPAVATDDPGTTVTPPVAEDPAPDLGAPAPGPGLAAAAPAPGPVRSRLVVHFDRPRFSADGRRLTVTGRVPASATGRLQLVFRTRVAGRLATVRATPTLRGGRFTATLRLGPQATRWRTADVQARYAGDARVAPGTATLHLVWVPAHRAGV